MKRCKIVRQPRKRRGTVFHYYMMYLFLSSILLTTAGLTLHAILKADQHDATASLRLKTLLQLDQALRHDGDSLTDAGHFKPAAESLALTDGDTVTMWSIDRHRITRTQRVGDQLQSSQRLVFPKGSELKFETMDSGSLVTLTVTDPPIMITAVDSKVTDVSPRHATEITFIVGGES